MSKVRLFHDNFQNYKGTAYRKRSEKVKNIILKIWNPHWRYAVYEV